MNKIKWWVPLILVFLILMMMGCASTQLVQSWQAPSFGDNPVEKILVLGVFENELNRRLYEDAVVKALEKENRLAITGYSHMTHVADYDEKEKIRTVVGKTNADAVMIVTLVGVEKKERYMPSRVYYEPVWRNNRELNNYYFVSGNLDYDPGYMVTDTIVKLEIIVLSVKTEQMIWSGATRSVNPISGKKIAEEAAGLIVQDMKKAGFI
ncbi:hypothetical protein [Desulfobacula sp.]|uniref:hypothetical protein n=1 Tax=Desulfobacula sp. TaxID=2593537 RepID=UPI00262FEA15|nr:hypothetical protein [Desulfobacula sp.]